MVSCLCVTSSTAATPSHYRAFFCHKLGGGISPTKLSWISGIGVYPSLDTWLYTNSVKLRYQCLPYLSKIMGEEKEKKKKGYWGGGE